MYDEKFMRQAIQLSFDGMSAGGGPFGAIVVKNGKIIGEGKNSVVPQKNPTLHAEIVAIINACNQLNSHLLNGCEIYCSSEPCPMCLGAIFWARIEKIYYGNSRTDAHKIGFDDEIIYKEVTNPHDKRLIPVEQKLRDDAYAAFLTWEKNPHKIMY